MRYIKKFNEHKLTDTVLDVLMRGKEERKSIKDQIVEISYILNDIDLDVYVGVGSNCVVVTIERKVDDESTSIETAFTSKRRWEMSLPTNDSYLEFIDRVEEICTNLGHKIYVVKKPNFTDGGVIRHYSFGKLTITNEKEYATFIDHSEIKDAIEYELKRRNPGIINRSLTWVGKKLNLI